MPAFGEIAVLTAVNLGLSHPGGVWPTQSLKEFIHTGYMGLVYIYGAAACRIALSVEPFIGGSKR